MTFGAIATGLTIATGINSITGGAITKGLGLGGSSSAAGGQDTSTVAGAQAAADPFAQYRAGIGAQYAGALQPGGSTNIESMPGFTQYKTGVLDPALQASQRAAAGTGQLYSGGEQQALQKTGQQGYYGFMTDYLNRLAQGSGAVNNPATAAGMGIAQGNANQQGVMQGLGGLATGVSGLSSLYGGSTGGGQSGYYSDPTMIPMQAGGGY